MNTQKLRDMNLHAVADELEQLRAFKEAVEKQEPVGKVSGTFAGAYSVGNVFFPDDVPLPYGTELYAKPVPADKPAVAVPDEWRRIVERAANMMRMSGVVSHKDSLNPLHSWLHDAESLLDAPSHSQQSALEPVEGDLLPPVGTNVAIHLAYNDKWVNHKVVGYYVWGPLGGVSDSYSRVFVRVVDGCGFQNARLLKDIKWDRCPSHESEQGGNNDV